MLGLHPGDLMRLLSKLSFGVMLVSSCVFAQAQDSPFQISSFSELDHGESYVTITNSGASSTVAFPNQNGALCANIYVFSPDATELACCSCLVPPNGLVSAAVKQSLLSVAPNRPLLTAPSVVVKVLGSSGSAGQCNATTVGTGANVLVTGLLASATGLAIAGTDPPAYFPTRTHFAPATLSAAELVRLTTTCLFNQNSPTGICKGCQLGGH
jgi:hypothetical protein